MPFDGTLDQQPSLAEELIRARLRFARNKIAEGKWCQKHERDDDGNRCLIGWARYNNDVVPQIGIHAIRRLWDALPPSARGGKYLRFSDVARYNDTHTRSSVIKLLDRAIVAMETT